MRLLRGLAAAFSVFSTIPMPRMGWERGALEYMLNMFPLVGAVQGLALWGWLELCNALGFKALLFAVGVALLPLAVNGGIHMDGFCDTVDALMSHSAPERRREILKDPHVGAFGAIGIAAYLMVYAGLAGELLRSASSVLAMGLSMVLSRALSAVSVLWFQPAAEGLASRFRGGSGRFARWLALTEALAVAVLLCVFAWPMGVAMLMAALACFAALYAVARRCFGGMSGDLSGWFLQVAELLMLLALVVVQKVVTA